MARKVSFSALESRSARLRLKVRRRPYSGPSLARGISLLYRRNKTNGTWVLKASDGHGAYWTRGFSLADDFEDADAKNVLTFYQAQDAAKKLARGEDGSADSAPITVDGALKAYKCDLVARSASGYNADWPRLHLTRALLAKPIQLLTASELKKWRDGLLGKIAPATINRLCGCLSAALALANQHDERIQNREAWEIGLAGLPNAQEARNSSCQIARCANSSPPPMDSIISLGCWPMCWRSPGHDRAKPRGCASKICMIIRCARNS